MSNLINGKLAIFAGRGNLPMMVIEECNKNNIDFQLFLLKTESYDIDYSFYNPAVLEYTAVEEFLEVLKINSIKNITFVGAVNKPNFSSLKVDKKGAVLLSKILANKILGDDAVLRSVINFFEKEGFKIIKVNDILGNLLVDKNFCGSLKPSKDDFENIEIGRRVIKSISEFDIGQAVIVAQRQVIAIEAVEGTDQMISRCQTLSIDYKNKAILVKLKKSKQSKKADLPVIGVETIKNCHKSNIKGIAIQSGASIVINKKEVIDIANKMGIFIIAL